MRRLFPSSLLFFALTAALFVLQMIPFIGIFLMFLLAMFWSVLLINAGMIGIAVEATIGRVSRWWLVVPLVFYGGYWAVAAQDYMMMRQLGAAYDAANAKVTTGFNPIRQALAFDGDGRNDDGTWLTQNYGLPVAYSANSNFQERFLSHRMMDKEIRAKVRETPALRAAFVNVFGFHDGDAILGRKMESRFCTLSMPERPTLPLVRVSRTETKGHETSLPITRVTTTITMPNGRQLKLLGGHAAPLGWIPMPIMGCGLNSGAPSWDCDAGFWRKGFTPIVSGDTRYSRDSAVLARALGLKRVSITERRGGDTALALAKLAKVEQATLARQLAAIDVMITDPLAKADWQVGVVSNHPEVLESRADAIMAGLERAVAVEGNDRGWARESGRILGGLLARLPKARLAGFGPRILAVYGQAGEEHWLWDTEPLLRRVGDLGPEALPYLLNRRASTSSVNNAGIEGLCRIGPAAREGAEPVLLDRWRRTDRFDRDERAALYVAMRRIGITPPPLPTDGKKDQLAELQAQWADISPASPPRVCAVRAERQARREEQFDGKRRTNLE
ncbi:hypothetical protein [Sphingobium sp. Z007]|uniref:hypothetical protein n=1 Tax=Sphingobium sp. Z007 TaxID=627495 RepID=UPI000B497BB3|nr:hypothetical protein [Sphingobium sp. Z007]